MKAILLAILLLTPVPAIAGTDDDYMACLIGWAGVAIANSDVQTADAALAIAYKTCPQPVLDEGTDLDGLEDMVRMAVEDMAKTQ